MKIIQWAVIIVLFMFWVAEDEGVHIAESIKEGEFEMEKQIIAQGMLDSEAEAVYQVYADGDIAIANSLGTIALDRDQAYALLEVLYQQRDRLRGAQDTVPLPEPETEQWRASGTCQLDPTHTCRDVFRCDGCQRMGCNQCGELVEDVWLCEACLLPKEPIMAVWALAEDRQRCMACNMLVDVNALQVHVCPVGYPF